MRILVIEDDKLQADCLRAALEEESYAVDVACDGIEGEQLADSSPYDTIILDLMLPGKDGFMVCQSLREKNIQTPILMLTGKMLEEAYEVHGLNIGADDYMTKPYRLERLLARIKALMRREPQTINPRLKAGDVTLDTITRQVWLGDKIVYLTGKEYTLLEYLMRHAGEIISRTRLESHIWGNDLMTSSNLVDANIKRLREKLDPEQKIDLIQTIRGVGYRLNAREYRKELLE